jgi:hypothetical protein
MDTLFFPVHRGGRLRHRWTHVTQVTLSAVTERPLTLLDRCKQGN